MNDPVFLVGAVAVCAGLLLAVTLLLTPSRRVSRERRRWGEEHESPLSVLAAGITGVARRLLGVRSMPVAEALSMAGVKQSPEDFLVLVGVAVAVAFALGAFFVNVGAGLLLALACPLVAWLAIRVLIDRRRKAFGKQLDEILQILAGSLRAGYSLPQGIATVATELEEPAASEFARVVNEARVGKPMVTAMEEASVRLANEDFKWTVQAIAINRDVGGNLADVLDAVGDTIRERIHLSRQVEALAADGKVSGYILTALPVAVAALLMVANPTYMGRLFTNPLGNVMIAVGVVLLIIGALWMRALVKIKF